MHQTLECELSLAARNCHSCHHLVSIITRVSKAMLIMIWIQFRIPNSWQIVLKTNISWAHPIILFVQCVGEDFTIGPEALQAFSLVGIVNFDNIMSIAIIFIMIIVCNMKE